MSKADFLLELGCEEIPAGYIPGALREMKKQWTAWLKSKGIEADMDSIQTWATPRRLAMRIPGMALEQARREELKLGPAVAAAFDKEGQPTKAAQGFARSLGVEVSALQEIETDRGLRLGLKVQEGGNSTRDLLMEAGVLRGLLQLNFPKTMRWVPGEDFRFARPLRWVVCLLGEDIIPMEVIGLAAGRQSRGHRTLAPGPVEISSANDYESALAVAMVIADPIRRQKTIADEGAAIAKRAGGTLLPDPALIKEVSYLVEHPIGVLGSFDPTLVELLPAEVITAAMRSHQRYFSLGAPGGGLLPNFITFRDGGEHGLDNVREGNERVLRARLEDARFYWESDLESGIEGQRAALERIVWLEGLGSIADKSARIAALAEALRAETLPGVDAKALARAAALCKADLATEMIKDGKEFTKLQGTIGRHYALASGETPAVAEAIEQHLRPRTATDDLPSGDLATLLALADRLDSLAGCTLAGFSPTGSQDPYALRRQALAVLRILLEREWPLDLGPWIDRALAAYDSHGAAERGEAADKISELFWGRLETLLSDARTEVVRAVLGVFPLDPVELVAAARALDALDGSEELAQLLAGAKRCRNILAKEAALPEEAAKGTKRVELLRKASIGRWEAWTGEASLSHDPALFEEPAETALLEAALAAVPRMEAARQAKDFRSLYEALATLGAPISAYFEAVMVNAERAELRQNRLHFLSDIHYLFSNCADLAAIPSR